MRIFSFIRQERPLKQRLTGWTVLFGTLTVAALAGALLQCALLTVISLCIAAGCGLLFIRRFLSPVLNELEMIAENREARDAVLGLLAEKERQEAQLREELARTQAQLQEAKKELDRLAYSRKTEIDPDDYQHFLDGIGTLTRMERCIFDWYLEGKTAGEILELAGIKEGTLKYHNHNILSKLGVSTRKQMLRFAAVMQQQDR